MAAVTIHSDFGVKENEIYHFFHVFPISHEVMGLTNGIKMGKKSIWDLLQSKGESNYFCLPAFAC